MKYSKEKIKRAKRLRKEENLGLGSISSRIDVPKSTISNWVSGKVPVDRSKATSIGVRESLKKRKPNIKDLKTSSSIKNRLKENRGHKCEKCGNSSWQSEPIPLEVHRASKNKDYSDCCEDDVILLCPNCHSLTDDYKGKNSIDWDRDKESIAFAINNNDSKAEALRYLGADTSGGSYNTLNRYIDLYGIDTSHMQRKNISGNKSPTCADCEDEISRGAKRCKSCAVKNRPSKVDWPSDEKLEDLVWEKPKTKIAQELGVSDRAVGKRCEKKGIETPGRGYWPKKRSNKEIT